MWPTPSPASTFHARRARVARALSPCRAVIAAGQPRAKNFPANQHRFRADSHFLYLVGRSIPLAVLVFDAHEPTLYVAEADPQDALWHGAVPSGEALQVELGLPVRPLPELSARLGSPTGTATLSPNEDATAAWLSTLLHRPIAARAGRHLGPLDVPLAEVMIATRLVHDESAIAQLRQAAEATALAHHQGARATRPGAREAEVAAAMMAAIWGAGMGPSYEPIVTVRGEILHNDTHRNTLAAGDLLLADVGAETPEGFAGDVTRVWPATGRFSSTQADLYDLVLGAQRAAIAHAKAGVRYRTVHETAARFIVAGLVDLGIFRGQVDDLVERGAHALFFPHGVGHLLGLDVHDMEDLGDAAGYAPGRSRPTRFGDRYLRLDRDLVPGMAVTIEPGFYQVPQILENHELAGPFENDLDRARLAQFADVRGIRIEDDVLITSGDPEVLTRSIPKDRSAIEELMRSGAA